MENLNCLMDHTLSDIQDYFKYINKKHEKIGDNPLIKIQLSKRENRITFKIKKNYIELLMPETRNLHGITKSKVTKDENVENISHLETTEVVLVHCNIANNDYKQDSIVLYAFVPNKSFGQLLNISPKKSTFLKTFNSKFSYIEVWFADIKILNHYRQKMK